VNTDIEYLEQLERDLVDAGAREIARRSSPASTPAARRRSGTAWARVAGVAAAFLVVAGAIGFVVTGGMGSESGDTGFSQVGSAVDGAGGGTAPQPEATKAPAAGGAPSDALVDAPETAVPGIDYLGRDERLGIGHQAGQQGRQQQDLSKIIRDGRISVVVPDGTFAENEDALTSIAVDKGGFVLSSSTKGERSGTFVLRIPAKRFDAALSDIRALGTVRSQQVTGDDVTAEFIDFQARLRLLEERRTLLSQLSERETTTDEILRFARLIDEVQLRIEQMQGQIRFINDQVAEATLRVTIAERNAPQTEPAPDIRNPNLASSVDLAVQGFLRIVGAVIVGLGYLIPLSIIAGLVWFIALAVRRRREP
jgi:hypothetical protein